jgi:hypothetical protein
MTEAHDTTPSRVLEEQQLRELVGRIVNSGALGRSSTYQDILEYLMECSIRREQPKEVAIAVDVLGRDADFDVGKDSIVRVHLYHLRSKLNSYFERFGQHETWRLEIPKGQYVLTSVPNQQAESAEDAAKEFPGLKNSKPHPWLAGMLAGLLILSLFMPPLPFILSAKFGNIRNQSPWQNILDDQVPILIVVGDYFIFGETDPAGNIVRMVRNFDINSSEELETLQIMEPDLAGQYYDLGLSYLPVGVASALTSIMPVLYDESDRVSVITQSQLNASDMTGNHIIYLGYISGLGVLEDQMFAASSFRLGETYDELVSSEGELYISDSGILNTREEFHDYGLVSTFTSPRDNQFLLIAGMRDAGLTGAAEQMAEVATLKDIAELTDKSDSWEGFFEVFGFDHTGLDTELLSAGAIDPSRIWGGE